MTRKRLFFFLAVTLFLTLLCVTVASAAIEPLKTSMELSAYKFSEPREIKVSISVANVGEGDMPGPVTLYYPNSTQIMEFGSPTLAVGVSKSWSGTWKVTQAQLEAGKVTFKIKYSVYNDDGELVPKTKNFSRTITYTGAEASVEVNRTIAPAMAEKGQEVSVTYDVVNSGTVALDSVTIKEDSSIASSAAKLGTIRAGEKASHTFKVKMGSKDLTSQATVTYKFNGKTSTSKVEKKVIKNGKVDLSATLKADKKGGAPGEIVKLTLTISNKGTQDFTDVTVTDQTLGTVFTGESVAAGKTLTLEKELTVTENQDLQFTVHGTASDAGETETTTGRVSVLATDPAEQIILNIAAEADRDTVYELPGTVRFSVTVTNNGNNDVSNVAVRASGVTMYTFPTIGAGESRTFSRDVGVSMAGQYRFDATCKDQLDQTLTFPGNVIYIGYAVPTEAPSPTPAITAQPLVLPPEPAEVTVDPRYEQVQEITGNLKWIFLGLGAACLALVLIGAVRRGQQAKASEAAMDHLERGTYRDYINPPVKKKGREEKKEDGLPEQAAPEQGETVQDEQVPEAMAETLRRLYEEAPNRNRTQVYVENGDGEAPVPADDGEAMYDPAEGYEPEDEVTWTQEDGARQAEDQSSSPGPRRRRSSR